MDKKTICTVVFPNHTDTKLIKKLKAKKRQQQTESSTGVTPCKVSDIHRKTERLGQYLDIKMFGGILLKQFDIYTNQG